MSLSKDEVLDVIRHIAVMVNNPALGGGGIGNHKTSVLLRAFVDLIDGEGDTEEDLIVFAGEVKTLLENHGHEQRDQWKRMLDRIEVVREKVKVLKAHLKERLAQLDQERSERMTADAEARRAAEAEEARVIAAEAEATRKAAEEEAVRKAAEEEAARKAAETDVPTPSTSKSKPKK